MFGNPHTSIYHIFKNLEVLCNHKHYEPVYLPIFQAVTEPQLPLGTWRFISPTGSLLAFPEDPTPLAAALAIERFSGQQVQRMIYQYHQPVISSDHPSGLEQAFFAGIEIFGSRELLADAEVMAISAQLAQRLGLGPCHLELGHAGLIDALLKPYALEHETVKAIKDALEQKRLKSLRQLGENRQVPETLTAQLIRLQQAFGRPEQVLTQLDWLPKTPEVQAPMAEIHSLLALLSNLPVHIHLDLGFSNHLGYYTGPVFKLYSTKTKKAIATGGRYDDLCSKLGKALPACGANYNLKSIHEVMCMSNNLNQTNAAFRTGKLAVCFEQGQENAAKELLNALKDNAFEAQAVLGEAPWDSQRLQRVLSENADTDWLLVLSDTSDVSVIDLKLNLSYKRSQASVIEAISQTAFAAIH